MGIFVLVLFPLDTWLFARQPIVKNAANALILWFASSLLLWDVPRFVLTFGIVLLEIGYFLTEVVLILVLYLAFGFVPDPSTLDQNQLLTYTLGSLGATFVFFVFARHLFEKSHRQNKSRHECGLAACIRDFDRAMRIPADFVFRSARIQPFNGLYGCLDGRYSRFAAPSFPRGAPSAYAFGAGTGIQKQLALYASRERDAMAWRHLRHDLLNFWEAAKEESR